MVLWWNQRRKQGSNFGVGGQGLLLRVQNQGSTTVLSPTRQALRNRWVSLKVSPQAARKKKRFTRLDMTILMNPATSNPDPAQGEPLENWLVGEFAAGATTKPSGSINPLVARNKLTYV